MRYSHSRGVHLFGKSAISDFRSSSEGTNENLCASLLAFQQHPRDAMKHPKYNTAAMTQLVYAVDRSFSLRIRMVSTCSLMRAARVNLELATEYKTYQKHSPESRKRSTTVSASFKVDHIALYLEMIVYRFFPFL